MTRQSIGLRICLDYILLFQKVTLGCSFPSLKFVSSLLADISYFDVAIFFTVCNSIFLPTSNGGSL